MTDKIHLTARWLLCYVMGWHRWGDVVGMEPIGATLSWAGKPTPEFAKERKCQRCGTSRFDRGWILPQRLVGEYYPEGKTWPHDPKTGKRLEIVKR